LEHRSGLMTTTISMGVSSITMTSKPPIPTGEITHERFGYTLIAELFPQDRNFHLKLKTGEVFCHPNEPQNEADKRIFATLSIHSASDERDFAYNRMLYLDELATETSYHPSLIFFRCFLPPKEFIDLLTNIRSGLLPSTVDVAIEDNAQEERSALSFGWEPDGSGMHWANDTPASRKTGIKIQTVTLGFNLLKATHDPETGKLQIPEYTTPVGQIKSQTEEIIRLLTTFRSDLRFFGRWIGIAIAVIAVIAAINSFVFLRR